MATDSYFIAFFEHSHEMRRSRADWMKPIDDQILEFLVDETVATPKLVADSLDYNNDYITSRFSELTNFGLTLRVSRGVYRLTDEGESYLAGELDASELETDEGN